jgi:hypothetical protein
VWLGGGGQDGNLLLISFADARPKPVSLCFGRLLLFPFFPAGFLLLLSLSPSLLLLRLSLLLLLILLFLRTSRPIQLRINPSACLSGNASDLLSGDTRIESLLENVYLNIFRVFPQLLQTNSRVLT